MYRTVSIKKLSPSSMESEQATAVSSASSSHVQLPELKSSNLYLHQLERSPKYQHYLRAYKSEANAQAQHITEKLYSNFTGHTLMGPDKIDLRSPAMYIINDKWLQYPEDIAEGECGDDGNYSVTFFHLGNRLTGHAGVIHGGLLATLLDELTCRLAFQAFPSKRGVTANLNINYRQPTLMDTYIMIKSVVQRKQGRKCWVKGSVYKVGDLESDEPIETKENLLADCVVLVVEPKWVDKLKDH
ncbi:hypothetical protein DIRU0_E19504 [Diutina rugosa]